MRGARQQGLSRTRPRPGKAISGLDALKGGATWSSSTPPPRSEDGEVVTVGGRVLGVTALGANLDAADRARLRGGRPRSRFDGMHYRKDIGQRALARLHRSKPA